MRPVIDLTPFSLGVVLASMGVAAALGADLGAEEVGLVRVLGEDFATEVAAGREAGDGTERLVLAGFDVAVAVLAVRVAAVLVANRLVLGPARLTAAVVGLGLVAATVVLVGAAVLVTPVIGLRKARGTRVVVGALVVDPVVPVVAGRARAAAVPVVVAARELAGTALEAVAAVVVRGLRLAKVDEATGATRDAGA